MLEFLLYTIIILIILAGLFFGLMLLMLKAMGIYFTSNPIEFIIRQMEIYLGQYGILEDYTIQKNESTWVDHVLSFSIKLTDINYQRIIDIISNPEYCNKLLFNKGLLYNNSQYYRPDYIKNFDKNKPYHNLWIVSEEGFHLNYEVVPQYLEGEFRLSIDGENKSKTISFYHGVVK